MRLAADDVQTLVIPGCAHWVAEETPEETLVALTSFPGALAKRVANGALAPRRRQALSSKNIWPPHEYIKEITKC